MLLNMKNKQALVFAAVLVVSFITTTVWAEPMELVLHRPYTVGEIYKRQIDMDETMLITLQRVGEADTRETRRVRVRFEAAMRVLAVNRKGQPTSELMRVDACELAIGDAGFESVIEPGRRITARLVGGMTIFRPQQGSLSPQANMALSYVVAYPTMSSGTLADLIAPQQPVQIDQSWPGDATAMAKAYKQSGLDTKPDDIVSNVTYTENVKVAGQGPCYRLSVNTTVNDFDFSDDQVPGVRDAAMNIRMTITLPFAVKSRYGQQQRIANMRFTSVLPDGIVMDHVIDRSMTATTSPLDH